MDLKRRLIISNTAIVVIPVFVTAIAAFVFMLFSSNILRTDISYPEVRKIISQRTELLKVQGSQLEINPDLLLDSDFQDYYAEKFSAIQTEMVLIKKSETVFSTLSLGPIEIEKCLQAGKPSASKNLVELQKTNYRVKLLSVIFKDDSAGTIIFLTQVDKSTSMVESYILFIPLVFLISFILTNLLSSLYFSRHILSPLNQLKKAAGEISSGNLNQEVVPSGDQELKDLCNSFEQMRLKLKESIHTQLKYDENRKTLLSSISHDLKTPITSIKGYVEGIRDGVANTPEKVNHYLKTIYSKASHMDTMIDDLLLFSKLDLNQIPFHFEKTDLIKYLQDCVFENGPELEKNNITLSLRSELKEAAFVMMDRERLKRVLNNILENSRKYMDKDKGEINLLLRENKSNFILEIQDNGSGISKEDLLYVFDRFYRSDKARSNITGSGLGLAIAKQIIEGHGGKIWIKSDPAFGTSIMISFEKI